ncbi:hypothetical protein AVEN_40237-1 [Araneus ventricosus]|uniref:Uncharacterized protein n=1 Tax=Araneus ventricosus TaxID=182803 RepID=A0A4Y2N218_ARAVE|nr:hypothetical protein AVEN_40237-1 [Araneus ventricosus]
MRSRRISKRVLAFPVGIAGSGLVPSIPMTGPTSYGRSWAVAGEGRSDSNCSAQVAVVAFLSFIYNLTASSQVGVASMHSYKLLWNISVLVNSNRPLFNFQTNLKPIFGIKLSYIRISNERNIF